jgi:hypothetical protein
MAEELSVRGVPVKRRNPWGVWALTVITLGIYGLVYWYKINREMRDVSAAIGEPFGNDPHLAWLAIFPGGIIIVPAILTYIYTARRVRRTQELTAPPGAVVEGVSSPLTVLLALVGGFQGIYLQYALNGCWDRATGGAVPPPPPPPPPPA